MKYRNDILFENLILVYISIFLTSGLLN